MINPYVISAELDLANAELAQIVEKNNIESFRESLDSDLRAFGKETVWVASSTIQNGLEKAIAKTKLPVLSLDDRYVSSAAQYLGVSRGVDCLLNDTDYVARCGYLPIERQLAQVARLGSEVMLTDDVLFSGEMVAWLANSLKPYGVKIGAVVVGVAIQEGIDKLAQDEIEVQATEVFDEVDDEICERDFAVVAGSGRRIEGLDANALYFDTKYGKPTLWASLPVEETKRFCVNSIKRSIDLIKPEVPMAALGRFLGYGSSGYAVDQLELRFGDKL